MIGNKTPARCFIIIFVIGVALTGMGLFIEPALPYFQLDVVLAPADLADQEKKDATLKLLKAARGNEWLCWTATGAAICILSMTGWRSLMMSSDVEEASSHVTHSE